MLLFFRACVLIAEAIALLHETMDRWKDPPM